MKDSKLISNPIQDTSHMFAEIAIKVPVIIELKNKSL
jgi:hypothetical protein